MKRAFIVNIDLQSGTLDEIDFTKERISEILYDEGFQVLSVEAWASHTEDHTLGLIPGQPEPSQQYNPFNDDPTNNHNMF